MVVCVFRRKARSPASKVKARVSGAAAEIIYEVGDDVRGSRLLREGEVFRREHVAVKTETEFHEQESRDERTPLVTVMIVLIGE